MGSHEDDGRGPDAVLDRVLDQAGGRDAALASQADLSVGELRALSKLEAQLFGREPEALHVDRYRLLERIGAGAMGVVYAALDPQLDRKVAIKLVHTDALELGSARLLREAQAIAKISHPHVIPVHDVGTYELGPTLRGPLVPREQGVFLVMEYVAGCDLATWLGRGDHTRDQLLAMFRGCALGLEAAHAAGVVHRDFKPANVLIGEDGRARVLDFGLARTMADDGDESLQAPARVRDPAIDETTSAVTAAGTVVGTPYYMAPEQYEARPVDARCDQFAFAVSLWSALSPRGPFPRLAHDALLRRKRSGRLEPVASSEMSPALHAVLVRALQPRPERRFGSMHELLAAFDRATQPPPRRLATKLAAGTLLGGALLWGWSAREPAAASPEPAPTAAAPTAAPPQAAPVEHVPVDTWRLAFAPFDDETGLAALDFTRDGLPNLIYGELRREGDDFIDARVLKRARRRDPRAWALVAADLGASHVVTGALRLAAPDLVSIEVSLRTAADHEVAHWQRTVAVEQVAAATRAIARELATAHLDRNPAPAMVVLGLDYDRNVQLGIAALEEGDHVSARRLLAAANAIDSSSAELHFYLAVVNAWSGYPTEAVLTEIELAARGPLAPAQLAFLTGYRATAESDFGAARAEFTRALEQFPDDQFLRNGLFEAQYHGGQPEEAMASFRELQARHPRMLLGLEHVLEYAEAHRDDALLEWAIDLREPGDPTLAQVWRALWAGDRGEYERAIAQLDELAGEPSISDGFLQNQVVLYHLLAGDLVYVREWAAQLDRTQPSIDDAMLALSLHVARGDADAVARARARLRKAAAGKQADYYRAEAWVMAAMAELPELSSTQRSELARTIEGATLPAFANNATIRIARALLAQDDPRGPEDVEATSELPTVHAIRAAWAAEHAGDDRSAMAHWREAMRLAPDSRFSTIEAYQLARVARRAGDPRSVREACDDVLRPIRRAWGWGVTIAPCLVWSAEAAFATDSDPQAQADARAMLRRVLALRDAAASPIRPEPDRPEPDPWVAAARALLAAPP